MVHMYIIFAVFEFEKWRAIRASVGGVGGMLAWVTCQSGDLGGVPACVTWVAN